MVLRHAEANRDYDDDDEEEEEEGGGAEAERTLPVPAVAPDMAETLLQLPLSSAPGQQRQLRQRRRQRQQQPGRHALPPLSRPRVLYDARSLARAILQLVGNADAMHGVEHVSAPALRRATGDVWHWMFRDLDAYRHVATSAVSTERRAASLLRAFFAHVGTGEAMERAASACIARFPQRSRRIAALASVSRRCATTITDDDAADDASIGHGAGDGRDGGNETAGMALHARPLEQATMLVQIATARGVDAAGDALPVPFRPPNRRVCAARLRRVLHSGAARVCFAGATTATTGNRVDDGDREEAVAGVAEWEQEDQEEGDGGAAMHADFAALRVRDLLVSSRHA